MFLSIRCYHAVGPSVLGSNSWSVGECGLSSRFILVAPELYLMMEVYALLGGLPITARGNPPVERPKTENYKS